MVSLGTSPVPAVAAASGPHFVGIGAPRCGTTWMYKLLRLHPQAWIPWKEIHFFDSLDPETDSGFDIQSRRFRLRTGWRHGARRLAANTVPGAGSLVRRYFPLKAVHAPGYGWTARYFLGDVTLDWYASLFREGRARGLCCGEITPAYFMLSERGIAGFAQALPGVRAILLLRNPVEWAWSDVCRKLRMAGREPGRLSEHDLIALCPVPTGRSRADFGSNLRRWLAGFPRERLLVGFHESIRTEPAAFFDRLCGFIGIDPLPARTRHLLDARINSSARGLPIPPAVERYVAGRFREEARLMAQLAGGPAVRWLEGIERVLQGVTP